jgi:hypothetical protein
MTWTPTSPTPTPAVMDEAEPSPNGVARGPERLTELRRRIDHLWQVEPNAPPSVRSRLLEQLARLDHEVERLELRTGDGIDERHVRACAARVDELMRWWDRPDHDRRLQLGAAPGSAA